MTPLSSSSAVVSLSPQRGWPLASRWLILNSGPVGLCAVIAASEWVKKGNLYAVDL